MVKDGGHSLSAMPSGANAYVSCSAIQCACRDCVVGCRRLDRPVCYHNFPVTSLVGRGLIDIRCDDVDFRLLASVAIWAPYFGSTMLISTPSTLSESTTWMRCFGCGCLVRGCLLRSFLAFAIYALASGLIFPTPSQSADIVADLPTLPDPPAAGSRVTGNPEADYSYLFTPFKLASQPNLKQSVFGFAGRTNSGNLRNTFVFGVGAPQSIFYDNYIVGGAYQRDFVQFNSGIMIGAEVGLADRFGTYKVCCDTLTYSNGVTHSAELWGGVSFRHQGFALFDAVRISPGFVFGLSAVSSPIGQEGLHQVYLRGNAAVLFYLGFDLSLALTSLPDTELVFRIHHRSGAYGTLGGMKEGNNANVIGIRQRF